MKVSADRSGVAITPETSIARSFRADAKRAFDRMSEAAAAAIHDEQSVRRIQGRVAKVQPGDWNWFVTLEDVDPDGPVIDCRIDLRDPEGRPIKGSEIEVEGKYVTRARERELAVSLVFRVQRVIVISYPVPGTPSRHMKAEVTPGLRRICLVTSAGSVAIDDFHAALESIGLANDLEVIPEYTRLEDGSPSEIAAAILSAASKDVGAIVLTRGGGHHAHIRRFSHPDVVDAVIAVTQKTPVLVAIGHDTDHVRAAAVASYSAATPTAAAHELAKWRSHANEQARLSRLRKRRLRILKALLVTVAIVAAAALAWWIGRAAIALYERVVAAPKAAQEPSQIAASANTAPKGLPRRIRKPSQTPKLDRESVERSQRPSVGAQNVPHI